jgi:hypothetical protein
MTGVLSDIDTELAVLEERREKTRTKLMEVIPWVGRLW